LNAVEISFTFFPSLDVSASISGISVAIRTITKPKTEKEIIFSLISNK
jgi:hypothetical protein